MWCFGQGHTETELGSVEGSHWPYLRDSACSELAKNRTTCMVNVPVTGRIEAQNACARPSRLLKVVCESFFAEDRMNPGTHCCRQNGFI